MGIIGSNPILDRKNRGERQIMPLIDTANEDVKKFQGLHLYHGGLSSCAQRVRITLAEKNLDWVPHVVDLRSNEHCTEEYQSIDPKGLIPTLVHDGQVIIESVDIIAYLDAHFPGAPLVPQSASGQEEVRVWTEKADRSQKSLKLMSHEFLFKPDRRMSPSELDEFVSTHKNKDLQEFMRKFSSDDGFSQAEIDDAVQTHHDAFRELDRALKDQEWLVENQFSLADIAWAPNVHRVDLMLYPLDRHPNLNAWYERLSARPSYRIGLVEHEPDKAAPAFAAYTKERRAEGTDVTCYGPLRDR